MHAIVEERWREERRCRILQAAGHVLAERGFRQASMDEIAAEAQVGKPTLYRYFPSKDALFAAVFVEALDEIERKLESALDPEAGIGAQLATLVRELVPMFRHHLVPLPVPDGNAAAADQSRRQIFRERRARIAGYFAAAIEAGIRRDEVREIDPDRVARLLLGMVWSAAATSRDGDEAIGLEIADLVLNGLVPRTMSGGPGLVPHDPDGVSPDHPGLPAGASA